MVSATGIGSGLDIEGLVTQLVAAERDPVEQRLVNSEARITAEISAFGQFQGALSGLQGALAGLSTLGSFGGRVSSSSDNSVLIAKADKSAQPGSYNVSVDQLAQAHSLASGTFSDPTSLVGSGSITIRFGTTDYTPPTPGPESYNSFTVNPDADTAVISIDSTNNTLEGVRDAINGADIGVNATILNDGTGYRLLISSAATGQENSLEISVSDTGDGDNVDNSGLSRLAFNASATNLEQTIEALDSEFTINGLSLTNSSNDVSDAIEGVSLLLQSISESNINVSITRDTASVSGAVQGLVSAYNTFVDTVQSVAGFDTVTQTGGTLQGDFTIRSISDRVRQMITGEVQGTTQAYSYLSEIGVRTDAQGRLSVNDSVLSEALNNDPDSIADLFAAVGRPTNALVSFSSSTDETKVGNYAVNITQAAAQATFTGAAIGLPITVDADNDNFVIEVNGTSSGTISLTQGSYTTGDDLAAELQTRINGDSTLSSANFRVNVSFNSGTSQFEIQTEQYGSDATIEFISADADVEAELGFATGLEVAGLDVAGTIGGEIATGSGQFLTADEGTSAEGLKLLIEGTATGSLGDVDFSRGIADQMRAIISNYIEVGGVLNSRTESLSEGIDDINKQREQLNFRVEALELRYRRQFNALDSLLAGLNSTSNFLSQQLAKLPDPSFRPGS